MLSPLFSSLFLSVALHTCPNTTNFTPNSTYQSNLDDLLSSLSSNTTSRNSYNTTTGGRDPSTASYGLFFCRGDVGYTDCQDCVRSTVKEVREKRPLEKRATIWYEECQLRYTNRSFFGAIDEGPVYLLSNTANITEQDRFNLLLVDSLKEAAAEAAKGGPGGEKFAMRLANFSGFQMV